MILMSSSVGEKLLFPGDETGEVSGEVMSSSLDEKSDSLSSPSRSDRFDETLLVMCEIFGRVGDLLFQSLAS